MVALVLANLVQCTITDIGTGAVTVNSATAGYLTPAGAGISDTDQSAYVLLDDNGNSEVGIGTYTASGTTFSRDTVSSSTNGGAKIALSGNAFFRLVTRKEDLQGIVNFGAAVSLPSADGTADQVLTTDGAGAATWEDAGGGGGGLVPISKTTASSDATIDIELTGGYSAYQIRFDSIRAATSSVNLAARVSTDGGSTFESGASDYTYHHGDALYNGSAATYFNGNFDNTAAEMRITTAGQMGNEATAAVSGTITLYQADPKHFWYHGTVVWRYPTTLPIWHAKVFGAYNSATAITDIRFLMSSGNITSGDFHLYGIADGA